MIAGLPGLAPDPVADLPRFTTAFVAVSGAAALQDVAIDALRCAPCPMKSEASATVSCLPAPGSTGGGWLGHALHRVGLGQAHSGLRRLAPGAVWTITLLGAGGRPSAGHPESLRRGALPAPSSTPCERWGSGRSGPPSPWPTCPPGPWPPDWRWPRWRSSPASPMTKWPRWACSGHRVRRSVLGGWIPIGWATVACWPSTSCSHRFPLSHWRRPWTRRDG